MFYNLFLVFFAQKRALRVKKSIKSGVSKKKRIFVELNFQQK
jgi:hypothetical protein